MLINPGAQQRVTGFEAGGEDKEEEKRQEGSKGKKWFFFSLWRFISWFVWESRWCQWGKRVAWVLERIELGLCSGLFPCHCSSLSLWGSWPEQPDLPQVAMDMEIRSKIEHKMVFIAFSLPRKKRDFCLFPFIPFGSWQKWSFLYLLEIHKAQFLGEKCHWWQAERYSLSPKNMLCVWNYFVNHFTARVSSLRAAYGSKSRGVIPVYTAGSNIWSLSLLESAT